MKPIVAGVAGTVLLAGAIFVGTFVSDKITVDSNVSEKEATVQTQLPTTANKPVSGLCSAEY